MLGAAGCGVDNVCCHRLTKDSFGWECSKYGKLKTHERVAEPIRAKQCGDDAAKDVWSKIQRDKR